MKHAALVFALVSLAACGGKILDERDGGAGAATTASPTPDPTPTPTVAGSFGPAPAPEPPSPGFPSSSKPSPAPTTVSEACETICHRNGECGAWQADCNEHCLDDARGPSCAAEARTYILCYGQNIEGCAALPPVCESAYCAYTRCAGKVVPDYCH